MLIVGTQRFNESHRWQAFPPQILEEVIFILEVWSRYRVAPAILERGVVVIEGEGLVVPLEQGIDGRIRRNDAVISRIADRAGHGIVPAAGVPLPADVLRAQTIPDCRNEGARGIGWVTVILGRQ